MELLLFGIVLTVALGVAIGAVVIITRGVFARDLTLALKRVTQQERELQEKADILEQRLAQLEGDYAAKLKRAQGEAERITQEAKDQAANIRTAGIEEAKHRARQLLLEAEGSKAQLRVQVAKELDGQAVRRACESLQALLPKEELSTLHHALTVQLLDSLPQLDASTGRDGIDGVEVVTAQPLTTAQSQRLQEWIATSIGAGLALHVTTDAGLVAGCIVRAGHTVIDNSLANRLNH